MNHTALRSPTENRLPNKRVQGTRHKVSGPLTRDVRQNAMKYKILIAIILLLLCLANTGCMCVHLVKGAGVHNIRMNPIAILTNSFGNVIIECEATDVTLAPSGYKALGRRFICVSASKWDETIARGIASIESFVEFDSTNDLRLIALTITAILPSNTSPELLTTNYVVFPPDLHTFIPRTLPPNPDSWSIQDIIPNSSSHYWEYSGRTNRYWIHHMNTAISDSTYKEWWWYPTQILLPFAYIADAVTGPF